MAWAYLIARAVKRTRKSGTDWRIFAAGVIAWLVTVISVPVIGSLAAQDMIVNGTVEVSDNPAAGIYPPVQAGSQVTVTDPPGRRRPDPGYHLGERLAFMQVNQDEQGLLPGVQLPPHPSPITDY